MLLKSIGRTHVKTKTWERVCGICGKLVGSWEDYEESWAEKKAETRSQNSVSELGTVSQRYQESLKHPWAPKGHSHISAL